MRFAFSLLLLFGSLFASAQFLQDVGGKPYLQNAVEEYEGSPLLFKAWVKADVTTAGGKVYKDMLVNVDLQQDLPIFQREGKVFTFSEQINEFTISDGTAKMVFKRGASVSPSLPNVLMEVISETPLVLKKHERNVVEVPSYGGSTKSFRYAENKSYYAEIDDGFKKITLSKESAEKLFSKQWKEIEEYAKKNNISFKTEDGWRKLGLYQPK